MSVSPASLEMQRISIQLPQTDAARNCVCGWPVAVPMIFEGLASGCATRGLQVEMRSFSLAQFSGSHEEERREFQRQLRQPPSRVALNRAQQTGDLARIRDGRMVLDDVGLRESAHVDSDIAG